MVEIPYVIRIDPIKIVNMYQKTIHPSLKTFKYYLAIPKCRNAVKRFVFSSFAVFLFLLFLGTTNPSVAQTFSFPALTLNTPPPGGCAYSFSLTSTITITGIKIVSVGGSDFQFNVQFSYSNVFTGTPPPGNFGNFQGNFYSSNPKVSGSPYWSVSPLPSFTTSSGSGFFSNNTGYNENPAVLGVINGALYTHPDTLAIFGFSSAQICRNIQVAYPCNSYNYNCVTTTAAVACANPLTGVTIGGGNITVCEGYNAGTLNTTITPAGATTPVTYQWYLNGNPIAGPTGTSANLAVGVINTPGSYVYRVDATNCGGTVTASKTINVVADPVSQTINPLPNSTTICAGNNVSATFSGGSGGAGTINDNYEYQINGGTWTAYIPGSPIATNNTTTSVTVRTRRTATGNACNEGSFNTYTWTVQAPPASISAPNSCVGGGAVNFTQTGGTNGGSWSISGGGAINAGSGQFTPGAPGCYTATYTTGTCSLSGSFVVYPSVPVLTAPVNTCNSAFSLPTVTAVSGFTVQYSINNGTYDASPAIPTTAGCHTVKARYVLTAACGGTAAGTAAPAGCAESAAVSVVIYPSAPSVPTVNTGCGTNVIVTPPVSTPTEFQVRYSYDDGATWISNNTATLTESCSGHKIRIRWEYTGSCTGVAGYPACVVSAATNRIVHTTPPTQSGGPVATSSTVECESIAVAPTVLPVVTDICGNTLSAPAPVISTTGTPSCEGTKTYTYTYTDCSGLQYVWAYTYTIDRTTAPVQSGSLVVTSSTVECESSAVAPTVLPVVTDICGNTLSAPAPVISTTGTPSCEGTKTYTYTYTDCSGLQYVWAYTYTIDRTTAPVQSGGPVATSSTVECESSAVAPSVLPVVTDICGNTLSAPAPVISTTGTPSCEGTKTYTYTYTDCSGLQYIWAYTYTIDRTTAPTQTGGPVATSSTVECESSAVAPSVLPVVTDICGNTLSAPAPVISTTGTPSCEGTKTYTYTYTDCSGLQYIWAYTYTIDRTTAPVQSAGPVATSSTVECESSAVAPTVLPVVTDICGNTLSAPAPVISTTGTPSCEGTKTYTYTYTDCSGLQYVWAYTYTIDRTTAPAHSAGPVATSSTVECESSAVAPTVLPVVTDVCGNTLSVPVPVISTTGTPSCEGTKTYTYTYTDCSGLQYVWAYTYTIDRTTAPTQTGGPVATSSTVECESSAVAPSVLPVVTDVCGNTLSAPAPVISTTGTPSCEGTKTYTYTYTDCSGLQYIWAYTYTIEHEDFTMPANGGSTVSCPVATNTVPNAPIVNDNCGNAITPTGPVVSAIPTCEGTRTYTWTYTDCEGNSHNWVYTYTVEREDFTMPANGGSTVQCVGDITTPVPPVVNDNCNNPITPTGPVINQNYQSCSGMVTYTWNYIDCKGNNHDWSYIYQVMDTQRPTWTTPSTALNRTVSCDDATALAAAQALIPAATDNCTGNLTPVKYSGPFIASAQCPQQGTYTNTWTVVDDCGNQSAVFTQIITVTDNKAPELIAGKTWPENETGIDSCSAVSGATETFIKSLFVDNCGGSNITVTKTGNTPVYIGCNWSVIYNYEIKDACGNTYKNSIIYSGSDYTKPVITDVPANARYSCAEMVPQAIPQAVTVTDNCDVTPKVTVADVKTQGASGNVNDFTIVRTWTATDLCGNSITASQTIIVFDDVKPQIISCANSKTAVVDQNCKAEVPVFTGEIGISQNCTDIIPAAITQVPLAGTLVGVGTHIITITVTDNNNNSSTCTTTFTVKDETAPVITGCKERIVIEVTNAGCSAAVPDLMNDLGITDNCTSLPGLIITQNPVAGTMLGTGIHTITVEVVDLSGNKTTCTTTMEVKDSKKPTVSCGADNISVNSNSADCKARVSVPVPEMTDNCGVAILTWVMTGATNKQSLADGINYINQNELFNPGVTTVTYTVYDKAGNNSSCSFKVTVTAPVITVTAIGGTACSGTNGTVTVTASGGTAPYQYSINNGAFQSSNQLPAGIGNHSIRVMDANGCTAATSVTVGEGSSITATIATTDVSCNNNGLLGSIAVTASGGTAPYQYSLNNGAYQNSNIFNNLNGGRYTIMVKDANGCTATAIATVRSANNIQVINLSAFVTHPLCNNATGSITTNAVFSGGIGQLTLSYNWYKNESTTVYATTPNLLNVDAGNYKLEITVTDAGSPCSNKYYLTAVVNQSQITGNISASQSVTIGSSPAPVVTFSATGGNAPYVFTYTVNNGMVQTITSSATGSATVTRATGVAGNYMYKLLSATDNSGCRVEVNKEAIITVTDTATTTVPDLSIQLTVLPSIARGPSTLYCMVKVFEINNVATTAPITVFISKEDKAELVFDPLAKNVGNLFDVDNTIWTLNRNANAGYYMFKTTSLFPGESTIPFGFTLLFTPGQTSGHTGLTGIILSGSGGEQRVSNNVDAEGIDFFMN